jgi:hypothetical protein
MAADWRTRLTGRCAQRMVAHPSGVRDQVRP